MSDRIQANIEQLRCIIDDVKSGRNSTGPSDTVLLKVIRNNYSTGRTIRLFGSFGPRGEILDEQELPDGRFQIAANFKLNAVQAALDKLERQEKSGMKIDNTNARVLVVVVGAGYEENMLKALNDSNAVVGVVDVTKSVQISNGTVSFLPIRITIEASEA